MDKNGFNDARYYTVCSAVSFDLRRKLFAIARRKNMSISEFIRQVLEIAVKTYEEVHKDGN